MEGTLDLFSLPEILQLVGQQRKTGILTVQGQQDIVAISFLNGEIVAADALNQTVEEGLAKILVTEGVLPGGDVARALSEHQSSGGRLIDHLVDRGYVGRDELLQVLRLQTSRLLELLLRWSEGDFKFYSGDEVSFEDGFLPISVEELLIHAAQANPPPRPGPRPVPPLAPVPVQSQPAAAPPRSGRPLDETASRPAPPAPRPPVRLVPPPAPVPRSETERGPFRKMRLEAVPAPPPAQGWVGKAAAFLLAAALLVVLLFAPGAILQPFPWQKPDAQALAAEQRRALYLKIDRAAKTYFLLQGRFPDSLEELVQRRLLSSNDLEDALGYPLRYQPQEESYVLTPLAGGRPVASAETTEAITGNFLLDPEFLSSSAEPAGAPLVLLD
jgi:hypothetical protein